MLHARPSTRQGLQAGQPRKIDVLVAGISGEKKIFCQGEAGPQGDLAATGWRGGTLGQGVWAESLLQVGSVLTRNRQAKCANIGDQIHTQAFNVQKIADSGSGCRPTWQMQRADGASVITRRQEGVGTERLAERAR